MAFILEKSPAQVGAQKTAWTQGYCGHDMKNPALIGPKSQNADPGVSKTLFSEGS